VHLSHAASPGLEAPPHLGGGPVGVVVVIDVGGDDPAVQLEAVWERREIEVGQLVERRPDGLRQDHGDVDAYLVHRPHPA
jgi:hypothetical protein